MNGLLMALALLCLTINFREIAACISTERDALVAFNTSIKDPDGRLHSWHGENCCSWSGVSCSKKTGHVIKLDLGEYTLNGQINPSLSGLTRLVYLNLSQSDFGGVPIPEFIGCFKMLRYLDLSHAGFGGTVPPQLGNLSRLSFLDLSSSGSHVITADDFQWVSKLTSLRYLDLSWLYLAASVDWLQAVNMLHLLEVLRLNDASLPATDLNSVSQINFTALKVIDLKNNELNSSLPDWIWNLSSLSDLDLSSCELSGRIPDELGKLAALQFIGLGNNKLNGAIPRSMSRLCNLVHIDLSRNILSGNLSEAARSMFPCMKKLQILNLADNKLTGQLSGWCEHMASLEVLDLSENSLSGVLPTSISRLSNLTYLDISFNKLIGELSELHFTNLSRLDALVLASNSFKVVVKHSWFPPFQLTKLGLHGCLVGPQFPTWLQSQTRIKMIDLGSAGIRGALPDWIWNFSSPMASLNVSMNNITGELPASLVRSKMLITLNIRHNQLEGYIPDMPNSVRVLDLSHNNLSGSLPQSFGDKELQYLSLSHNSLSGVIPAYLCDMISMELIDISNDNLSGELPNCWRMNSSMYVIDFSSNNFWGEIPSTMGSLSSLTALHLSKNSLSGLLPTSLQSCKRLLVLDVGANNLSGYIPTWIGNGLQTLLLLILGSNQFSGEIPEELSQLHALQYLDLSNNKLSGSIPRSLGKLTSLLSRNLEWDSSPFFQFMVYGVGGAYFSVYKDTLQATFRGYRLTFVISFLLTSIDLSENHLTGEIPSEIGNLYRLASLNLSRNHIEGSIPETIGNLAWLESLDLSWNDLSGPIPQSMKSLLFLSFLNLSYNHLSGMIPYGNQLMTFEGDSFLGNEDLCGAPLTRSCHKDSDKHKHHEIFDTLTYMFTLLGFAFGFCTVSTTFIFSAASRRAYFQFTDNICNWLVAVLERKLSLIR